MCVGGVVVVLLWINQRFDFVCTFVLPSGKNRHDHADEADREKNDFQLLRNMVNANIPLRA
jgi:hypothetical protein